MLQRHIYYLFSFIAPDSDRAPVLYTRRLNHWLRILHDEMHPVTVVDAMMAMQNATLRVYHDELVLEKFDRIGVEIPSEIIAANK